MRKRTTAFIATGVLAATLAVGAASSVLAETGPATDAPYSSHRWGGVGSAPTTDWQGSPHGPGHADGSSHAEGTGHTPGSSHAWGPDHTPGPNHVRAPGHGSQR